MKNYIYKLVILTFFLFIAYEITFGRDIRFIKQEVILKISSFEMDKYKVKIREDIEKLLKQERLFYGDDAKLLSEFIKKILTELELK